MNADGLLLLLAGLALIGHVVLGGWGVAITNHIKAAITP